MPTLPRNMKIYKNKWTYFYLPILCFKKPTTIVPGWPTPEWNVLSNIFTGMAVYLLKASVLTVLYLSISISLMKGPDVKNVFFLSKISLLEGNT